MAETRRYSIIKPTTNTPFHIDFEWWMKNDSNWRVYLVGYLCDEHKETYKDLENDVLIDAIHPDTAEISQVDGIQNILITHCAKQEHFISENTTLVESVFRILLANGNKPMTPEEIGDKIGRPAITILKTLAGQRVYKGIRPTY